MMTLSVTVINVDSMHMLGRWTNILDNASSVHGFIFVINYLSLYLPIFCRYIAFVSKNTYFKLCYFYKNPMLNTLNTVNVIVIIYNLL